METMTDAMIRVMLAELPEPPTLYVEQLPCGCVRVWCRYCDAFHSHGDPTPVDGTPYRVAHCWVSDSPYKAGGYRLEVVPRGTNLKPPRSDRHKPRYVGSHILHGWSRSRSS